jgi:RHS repeat-associated protein
LIKDNSNQTFLKYWKRITIILPTLSDGLKHTNYNSDIRKYTKETDPITQLLKLRILPPTDGKPVEYKYKYNGKEWQDELGLNLDNYKWRNYDYAIGRFISIDPLARDFPQWSPYVFSGNLVIISKELEGLEPEFMIGQDGKLTSPMVTLINSAFGYSWKSLTNTNWVPHMDARATWFSKRAVPNNAVAITLGNKVVYDSALQGSSYVNSSRGKEYWFSLISHEQRHRFDIDNLGNSAFYSTYGLSAISAIGIHDNIAHEQIANKYEAYAEQLWNYKDGAVQDILQNSSMSNNEKSSKLEVFGAKFKRDVILEDVASSANSVIESSQKALEDAKGTIAEPHITSFLNNLIKVKKGVLQNARNEQAEITKKYGN